MPVGPGQPQRATRGCPREHCLLVRDVLGLGFRLGQAHPSDLGIGVGDGRDRPGVELDAWNSGDHLSGHLRLVRGLVGEHRLTDDVADRKDVRHVGPHLAVDWDEAALVDVDAGRLGADGPTVGHAADRTRGSGQTPWNVPSENSTLSPLRCALTEVTLVPSRIAS